MSMQQGRTSDGRAVQILKRSSTSTLVRTLDDDVLRYLPNGMIFAVDADEGARTPEAPLSVRVARAVAGAGFITPQELMKVVGTCESELAPVAAHLVRTGVLHRREVAGVTGYIPAEGRDRPASTITDRFE